MKDNTGRNLSYPWEGWLWARARAKAGKRRGVWDLLGEESQARLLPPLTQITSPAAAAKRLTTQQHPPSSRASLKRGSAPQTFPRAADSGVFAIPQHTVNLLRTSGVP